MLIFVNHRQGTPMNRRTVNPSQFGIATIMLIVTLVAICLAVLRISTFFGVIGLLLAPPSLARTVIMGRARLRDGERFDHYDKLELFGESVAVSMLAYVAAIAAAFALWISIVSLVWLLIVFLPNNSYVEPVAPALFVFAASTVVIGAVAMLFFVLWKLTVPYMGREVAEDRRGVSGNTDLR